MSENQHILIGETIHGVMIAKDKQAFKFNIGNDREIVAKTDGNCCSHTWIEHVSLPTFPCTVISVKDTYLKDENDGEEKYYSFKIVTDKGFLEIEYRNSSNGYYGGNIWFPNRDPEEHNYFYGGVYGQNESEMEWVKVEE